MIPPFKNILEAQAYFHNEQVCREHLERLLWNGKPVCPYCGVDKAPYKLKDGKRYRCSLFLSILIFHIFLLLKKKRKFLHIYYMNSIDAYFDGVAFLICIYVQPIFQI